MKCSRSKSRTSKESKRFDVFSENTLLYTSCVYTWKTTWDSFWTLFMSWEKSVSAFHVIFLLSSLQPWPSVSNLAKDFIDRVLTVDPSERLTAGQALKHPWIVSMAASSSMKNLQRCISQNLLKRASSRCQSTKSAQSTRSSRSSKSGRARRVREKELRELNRRYQQQYNGWRKEHAVTLHMLVQTLWDPLDMCR